MDNEAMRSRWNDAIIGTYGTPSLALVRGEGNKLWDADGKEYLDFVAGIAVNLLGHGHPRVVEAVTRQIAELAHISNLYISPPAVTLAERLLGLFGRDGRVFFCNSGAEANEAAFKIARKTGRPEVIAAEGSFHGRTMGALSLTGQPARRAPFEPLPGGVRFVPCGDSDALENAVNDRTAAVFLEPIQGEAGIVPPPPGYLAAAREITTRNGALLVIDEVQCGMGRTGVWFAHQTSGVAPDVVTLAKGLGGGLPLGACLAFGNAATLLEKGEHATTFGGNPVCCAAALAVLDVLAEEDLPGRAKILGERLRSGLLDLGHPLVTEVRGAGLLLGIQLNRAVASDIEAAALEAGILVNAVRPDVVRLEPALILTSDDVERFLSAFRGVLKSVE